MSFNLVRLSQQDPRWKNIKLGYSNDSTIGAYGCAMTSVAMFLSGFGYPETPESLNAKLKQSNGYVQDAIVWSAINGLYSKVRFKNLTICRDTDAPIDAIGNAIAAGQPVLLEVDSSPKAGLQTHWVVAYQKVGKDFLILDPWPYPTEDDKDVSLMARYSQGKELKRSITAVVWYECSQAGDGVEIAPASAPADGSLYVRVNDEVVAGLRVRSAPTTVSETLSLEYPGSFLKVVEAEATARPKIGVYDQWLRVRNLSGIEGYTAAWFVRLATSTSTVPSAPSAPEAPSTPETEPAPNSPEPASPSNQPPASVQRVRPSVADGLEAVATAVPADRRLQASASQSGTYRLVADIWNRYGGLLGAMSTKLGIEPAAAVAVLAIESGGQAFGPDGRTLIRFENHLFYNYWGKNNLAKFNQHFTFDLNQRWVGHKWREKANGTWIDFHGNQSKEWDVFNFAAALDDTAAKLSISMGAPQIVGFNFSVIGYASVQDMFTAFARSDRDQVIGFFDFVNGVLPAGGAVKHLQRKDFTAFATVYNGSGQASYYGGLMKNGYDAFNVLYKALSPVSVTPPTQPETPSQPQQPPAPETPSQPSTPSQPQQPPTPETPSQPSTPSQPQQPPTPETPSAPQPPDKEKVFVKVLNSVGASGLRMRKIPSTGGLLIAIQPAGASLRLVDPKEKALIGKQGSWLQVRDRNNRPGYVAAWLVELDKSKSELNTAVSFSISDFTEPEPYRVYVSSLAGKGGLRLRKSPSNTGEQIKSLLIGTPLEVLDDAVSAQLKVGRYAEWIKVKEPLGAEGYVAAWFLEE